MTNNILAKYTPAYGRHELTNDYDKMIARVTREQVWRPALLDQVITSPGQTVIDIGSGTGSMAILIKQQKPELRLIAIDPDSAIRQIAERKAQNARADIEFITALGHDALPPGLIGQADIVISSLVFHQCPLEAKIAVMANMYSLLKPGGRLLISDFGKQRSIAMKLMFNLVRMTDGYEDTRINKQGLLPRFIAGSGFIEVEELVSTSTFCGSISLYSAYKPSAAM